MANRGIGLARAHRAVLVHSSDALAQWGMFHHLVARLRSRQAAFADAFETGTWSSTGESRSGDGSEMRFTVSIRAHLPLLLERLEAKTLLDAPCGDWNWMQHVRLPVEQYVGVDIVRHVITENRVRFGNERHRFEVADLTRDELPVADVILCRDCLVHCSFEDIAAILENFRTTGATWLLLNSYPNATRNRDQFTGQPWRPLNFMLPPFGFPEPVEVLPDHNGQTHLAIWRLQELPHVGTRSRHQPLTHAG
jgi:hypothetical protein